MYVPVYKYVYIGICMYVYISKEIRAVILLPIMLGTCTS